MKRKSTALAIWRKTLMGQNFVECIGSIGLIKYFERKVSGKYFYKLLGFAKFIKISL